MHFFLLFIICCVCNTLFAFQNTEQDSLIRILETSTDKYEKRNIYYSIVDNYYLDKNTEQGDFYFLEMKKFTEKEKIESSQDYLLILQSYKAFFVKNKVREALVFGVEAIGAFEEKKDTSTFTQSVLSTALNEIAYFFEEAGIYDKALTYYLKGIALATKNNDENSKMYLYNDISFLFSEHFEDKKKGIAYIKKSIELAKQQNNIKRIGDFYGNLAMIYIQINELEKADTYLAKSIEIAKNIKDTSSLAHTYLEKARLDLKRNNLEKARKSVDLSLSFFEKNCYQCYKAYTTNGVIFEKEGQFKKAENAYLLAKKNVDKYNLLSGSYNVLIKLANLAKKKNQLIKAANYYSEAFERKDSLDNSWKVANVLKIQIEAELKEKEAEKQELEFKRQLLKARVRWQWLVIFLITLLLFISLFAAHWIFKQKKGLEQSYQLLVKKNQELILNFKEKNKQKPSLGKKKTKTTILKKLEGELLEKLEHALREEKVFKNKNLTLTILAEQLSTNTTYLSKFINNHYNKRFNILINEYRVREVLLYFETDQLEELTIFALAQKAGFSSKSAFNLAFKTYTGVTPSFYLKNKSNKK